MDTEYEQIHRELQADPEATWGRLARFLCSSAAGSTRELEFLSRADLIEDLMFSHADAFIDRLEQLIEDCPKLRPDIAMAHVGGIAAGPGLQRFYALQESVSRELEATGELTVWRGLMSLHPSNED
jgi:hypothetical protein